MPLTEIAHYQSDAYDLWLGRFDDGELLLDGYVKVATGLKHLVWRVQNSKLTTALDLVLQHGRVVDRPYVLGQPCDGSIDAPVIALYLDFCTRHALGAQALYAEAYPGEKPLEENVTTTFALWQGVAIPHTWTAACFSGLLESLAAINNHSLRGVLEEAAEAVSFLTGVMEREGYTCFRGDTRCYSSKARFTWGHVITPTGEQVWQYDPWQSTNGVVPGHYWLSFIAVAASRDGNMPLALRLIEEAKRAARSPANKRHYRGWLENLEKAA